MFILMHALKNHDFENKCWLWLTCKKSHKVNETLMIIVLIMKYINHESFKKALNLWLNLIKAFGPCLEMSKSCTLLYMT